MMREGVSLLDPEQCRFLAEMAEQARAALSRYVGHDVTYNATALQFVDEWIDRHMRQLPNPSQRIRLLWVSFLGEILCRRNGGEWAVRGREEGGGMVVLCPTESGGVYVVDVAEQVNRRIAQGMAASLVYFYTATCIELRAQ